MKASDFNQKDKDTLKRYFNAKLQYIEDKEKANKEVNDFFDSNSDIEYNDFLNLLEQKYGNVLKLAKEEKFDRTEEEENIEKQGIMIGGTIQLIGGVIAIILIIYAIYAIFSI